MTAPESPRFSAKAERAIAAIVAGAPALDEKQIALLKPLFSGR